MKARNHVYFHSRVSTEVVNRTCDGWARMATLCSPKQLTTRTDSAIRSKYKQIADLSAMKNGRAVTTPMQDSGFSHSLPSQLLTIQTVRTFSTFPIDTMHLPYGNFSQFIASIWYSSDSALRTIAPFHNTATIVWSMKPRKISDVLLPTILTEVHGDCM